MEKGTGGLGIGQWQLEVGRPTRCSLHIGAQDLPLQLYHNSTTLQQRRLFRPFHVF
jgi:hypothetical protein